MKGFYEQSEFEHSDLSITCIESSLVQEGHIVHPHWHDHMEILYVKSGHALQQVDNVYKRIKEGDIVIIGANQVHGTYPDKGSIADIKVYQIKILKILKDKSPKSHIAVEAMSGGLAIDIPLVKGHDGLISMLEKILTYKASLNLCDYYEQKALLIQLVASLIKTYPMKMKEDKMMLTSKAREALSYFFTYLSDHYADDLDVNEAALLVGYSRAQFNRLLKMATGYAYIEYLNRTRIDAAIGRMIEGYSITESATMSGFTSISSFNRYFKRYKASSPRDYIKDYL